MILLFLLCVLTAVVGVTAYVMIWHRSGDTLEPMLVAIPIAMFFNVMQPLILLRAGLVQDYYTTNEAVFVQTISLLLFLGFCAGGIVGTGNVRWSARMKRIELNEPARRALLVGGCILGIIGSSMRGLLIWRAGGILAMYGRAYGGNNVDQTGWLLDAWYVCFSGIILIAASSVGRRPTLWHFAAMLLFALPHVGHALLGARRGPLFAAVTVVGASLYLFQYRRPKLVTIWLGGVVLGYAILLLVANRENIYLGAGEREEKRASDAYVFTSSPGVEFFAGGGKALAAEELKQSGLGLEWLTVALLRPIPREWMPDKYEVIPDPQVDFYDVQRVLGWGPAPGAAETFLLELFKQFRWFGILAAFAAGWLLSRAWRFTLQHDDLRGLAMMVAILQGLLHLMAQDFKAFVVPFLMIYLPCHLVISYVQRGRRTHAPQAARAALNWNRA
ncbi:hypothetical protein BH09PLA1_BH09PLA1_24730 [soil metagenome]